MLMIQFYHDMILLGGSSLQEDHDVQYFTTGTLEAFFCKAHPNFPLALHIKISFYIMLLDTAYHCANTSDGSF